MIRVTPMFCPNCVPVPYTWASIVSYLSLANPGTVAIIINPRSIRLPTAVFTNFEPVDMSFSSSLRLYSGNRSFYQKDHIVIPSKMELIKLPVLNTKKNYRTGTESSSVTTSSTCCTLEETVIDGKLAARRELLSLLRNLPDDNTRSSDDLEELWVRYGPSAITLSEDEKGRNYQLY